MDENVIDVTNLTKRFDHKIAVNQLSLQVKKGEIFGFLGPNGSGKTTTIRMLCGLLTPNEGKGHCLGYDILTESYQIKLHVGYLTQKFSYYEDLSIEENLKFIAKLYALQDPKRAVDEAIESLGIEEYRHQLAGTLSGGWKQRVALAACLLHKPDLLLLDEPTAGVDPSARHIFWEHLSSLSQQGITSLVSTHYMDEAERCNHLAYIFRGKMIIEGTSSEIIQKTALITWEVTGKNIVSLARELQALPTVLEVVIFGDKIHVCAKDKIVFLASIQQYVTNSDYQFTEIPTTLEDTFIYLAERATKVEKGYVLE